MPNPSYQGIIKPKGLEGLKPLRSWGELSQEEKASWLDSHPHAKKYSPAQLNVAYRNNNYLETLGEPIYNSYDKQTLGSIYKDKVVNDAFGEYYKDDSNFQVLNSLTTESKQELLESGYLNEKENKEVLDTKYEEYAQGMKDAAKWAPAAPGTGGISSWDSKEKWEKEGEENRRKIVDALVAKDNKRKVENSKEDIDALYNFYTNGQAAWGEANNMFQEVVDGKETLENVVGYMALNGIITPEQGQNLINRPVEQQLNLVGEILSKSDFNPSRIDTIYDSIARPKTVQGTSEFGEVEDYQMPGSRTYNALKDTKRFKDFSASDKLKEYATWQVLANKYGVTDAISNLETSMMDYANDHETAGDWWTDVGINVAVGGIANIMNKVNAVSNIVTEATQGREALAYKLQGKNADGSERVQHEDNGVFSIFNWFKDNWDNPYYWSKVDEYNTLDPLQIAEFDANGGISPMVTVRPPDEVVPFFSTETLKEALKMTKFIWSDYLTGRLLGDANEALASRATKSVGTEFGQAVGKLGAAGIVAASGMGIAESYGVMTYEQAYQQMMESLDSARDKTAQQYVQQLMNSKEGKAQIDAVVDRIMKQQQEANAGKENGLLVSEKDIRAQVEEDFINYYTQQYNNSDDAIKSRQQDEELARKAAVNAYMVAATIEEIRMAAANFTFRKFLFDSGTRRRLGDNKRYGNVTENAEGSLVPENPKLNKAWATIKPVWGGFQSNYFDDVTVGFGKGFGLEQYNAYLQDKYDASKAGITADYPLSFLEGLGGAIEGAGEALVDRQSFYDGFVGALGSPMSLMPRVFANERTDALRRMNREDAKNLTAGEWINKWFMNPLLDAYYEERGKQERTTEALPVVTKAIADHKDALEDINQLIISLNSVADADVSGSHIQRADAKANLAFKLLYTINGLSSAPLISEHSLIQNAAAEIDRLARGEITDAEISDFLAQPENKSFGRDEAGRKAAAERIQKNAKSLQDMNKKISKARQSLEESVLSRDIDPGLKEQLVYQLVMDEAWQERLSSIEATLSGKPEGTEIVGSKEGHNAIAAYGSSAEFERQWNAHKEVVRDLDNQIRTQKKSLALATELYENAKKDSKSTAEEITRLKNTALMLNLNLQQSLEARREADVKAKELERDASTMTGEEISVLSAEQILNLNPVDRNTILDKKNRNNYSAEQQVAIDEALSILKSRTPDAEQLLSDAAALSTRIKDNKKAYRRLQDNPDAASAYYTSIITGRTQQLQKVFAQRRLDEAFKAFDAATTNDELLITAKQALNSKELGMNSKHLDSYIKRNPKKAEVLSGLRDVAKIREDAHNAVNDVVKEPAAKALFIKQLVKAINDSNNSSEAMAALEELVDIQTDATAKRQYDMILEKMKSLGHQRDATKLRNRELERQRKQEAELKRLEEEEKKDGKNYHWNGFKVGDTVYNKKTGGKATVVGFEKEDIMVLEFTYKDGTVGRDRFSAEKYKDALTKDKPSPATTTTTTTNKTPITEALERLEKATKASEKVAAINQYENAKYNGAKVTAEEEAKITAAKKELASKGYEMVDMLGKPYSADMNATVTYTTDDTLAPGETMVVEVKTPQVNKDGSVIQSADIVVAKSPVEISQVEDVPLTVDNDGKAASPTATQQAAAEQSKVVEVPTSDVSEQGNVIVEDTDHTISGNRYVTYSVANLKDGKVVFETPENPNSIFGKFVEWVNNNNIKIQEIIDEEFGRIITDIPDIKIRFMKFNHKKSDIGYKLQNNFINVIELTPELRNKYHKEDRGGVIQFEGKSWLVVGITGFDNGNIDQRRAYDTMKAPINKRRDEYFAKNPDANYYIDSVAYSQVQNTTSGRIVNQKLGQESPTLKKVSELLKSAGMSLKQAMFGIQTAEAGEKSFATTKNVKGDVKVFPPRNVEDNRGRTFILIDTANGNKIPGMIEPAMYNELAEDSPLKEMINSTIAQLFSTNYENRVEAIKQLCGLLVLNNSKNILIGKKDSNVITITREGMPDIVQKLGNEFDSAKFFKDLENANFQVNISLKSLNDPTMLKIYDDSGALMTTVDSMRTAGMSYSIYMTDAFGKPIMTTPVGNAVPGTGRSELRPTRSVRVNNTTYEFKNGQWVNRSNGNKVNPGTALEKSVIYNDAIQSGNWQPFNAQDGKEYYSVVTSNGDTIVITRDGLGNVVEFGVEESNKIFSEIQRKVENKIRADNLEDVDLSEAAPSEATLDESSLEDVSLDQLNQQVVGEFEAPSVEAAPVQQQQKEVIKEAVEAQPQQNKEVIVELGKKSLSELQNTKNLTTFDAIAKSVEYGDELYDVLESKGWGITGDFASDAEILKSHNISITGISNIKGWIDFIRDCR